MCMNRVSPLSNVFIFCVTLVLHNLQVVFTKYIGTETDRWMEREKERKLTH